MNTEAIDKAFAEMIQKKGIHETLGLTANAVYQYRNQVKNGIAITLDKKLELLKKSGWKEEDVQYSRKDLVSLVKFVLKTSQAARENGPEYIVEKWKKSKK